MNASYNQRRKKDGDFSLFLKVRGFDYGNAKPNARAGAKGVLKYAVEVPSKAMNDESYLAAWCWTKTLLRPMYGARMWTFDESCDALDMTTSPGFPWNQKHATKVEFFENGGRMVVERYVNSLENRVPLLASLVVLKKKRLGP